MSPFKVVKREYGKDGNNGTNGRRSGTSQKISVCSVISVFSVLSLLLPFTACERNAGLPKPDSKEYRDLVTAFYVGLAGLQTGEDVRAKEKLTRAPEIAPGEPAGWANLGLLAV